MENTKELEKEIWTKDEVEAIKSDLSDKYVRLYAEFENYKKRSSKEKEDIKNQIKANSLSVILDFENDLSIAFSKIEKTEGIKLILSKVDNFLHSQGIDIIQTEKYDPELHEVVSVIESGEEKIVDVVSKGYTLNGNVIRYPKIILSKK